MCVTRIVMQGYLLTYLYLFCERCMLCDVYCTEAKGFLSTPCLPGDVCVDVNAECESNVCLCPPTFFVKNSICREFAESRWGSLYRPIKWTPEKCRIMQRNFIYAEDSRTTVYFEN